MKCRDRGGWEPEHRASVRHRVAVEAARMLYHREVKEYYHAKREAARRQGTVHLPSNWEVHEQLLLIARKVDGDEHDRRLTEMRRHALALMELLADFQPRLIGSVLTGHIRKGSDIDLHVYTDDFDGLCRTLEEAGHAIAIEVVTTRKHGEPEDFTHVRIASLGGFEVEITVYPPSSLRVQPRCGITGRPMRRATVAELRHLLQDEAPRTPGEGLPLAVFTREEIARLVPELQACQGVLQNHYHHLDVHEHTWEVISILQRMVAGGFASLEPWAASLRRHLAREASQSLLFLAAVCHDLGKPATQSLARDGRIRFIGHDRQGADLAGRIGPRLGLDATDTRDLCQLVAFHLEAVRIPSEAGEPSRIRRMMAAVGDRLPELALLSLADVEAARGPAQTEARLEEHREFVDFLFQQYFEGGFLINPSLPVSAEDLLEQFGSLEPRSLERVREWLLDAFVDGEFEGREEGLELASEFLARPSWER